MWEPQPPLETPAGAGPSGDPGSGLAPPPPEGPRPDPEPATAPVTAPVTAPAPVAREKRHSTRRSIIEWGSILAVAVIAALLLRAFVIQPYFIPSGSMEPTLKIGDKVLVDKLSYHMHAIHRGDVVVFKKPPNDYSPDIKDLIKRVIGLPHETISASGGRIFIDGRPLPEPWLPKGVTTSNFSPVSVPAGEYFVMGDNRGNSADSRVIGPISGSLIVGRAFLIVWPIGHIGTL